MNLKNRATDKPRPLALWLIYVQKTQIKMMTKSKLC